MLLLINIVNYKFAEIVYILSHIHGNLPVLFKVQLNILGSFHARAAHYCRSEIKCMQSTMTKQQESVSALGLWAKIESSSSAGSSISAAAAAASNNRPPAPFHYTRTTLGCSFLHPVNNNITSWRARKKAAPAIQ